MSIEWDEVFTTGEVKEGMPRAWAVATALSGWGPCMSGTEKIPENFGKGMAALISKYDISPTPDSVSMDAKYLTDADYENYRPGTNHATPQP